MFRKHDADRSMFPRDAGSFQRGKEMLFFFAVVAAIGKHFEKLKDLPDMLNRNIRSRFDVIADRGENVKDNRNRLMLLLQLPRGIHRCVLSIGLTLKQDKLI
jgi:hypothetical protein